MLRNQPFDVPGYYTVKDTVHIIYTNGWLAEQQANVFKPFDLTGPQFNVLRILKGQYPKPCTVNLIIDRMLERMSNASRIIDRLERKGWVERKICKSDRRAKDVIITPKGLDLLEEVNSVSKQWMKRFKGISEERVKGANDVLDLLRKD